MKDYALYKGDRLLTVGNIRELSAYLEVNLSTVYFYASNVYKKRVNEKKAIYIVKIDEEEGDI